MLPGFYHPYAAAPVATGCTDTPVLREVVFYGALRKEFGASYQIVAASPSMALNGLMRMVPNLHRRIADGSFRVVVGRSRREGRELVDAAQLARGWAGDETRVHIVPVTAGRGGRGGIGKAILGIALIAVAVIAPYAALGFAGPVFSTGASAGAMSLSVIGGTGLLSGITFGHIAAFGAMMALGGISQMMSPQPKTPNTTMRERPGENPSLVFNSIVNAIEEGGVVPLIYGDVLVGSQVIAAGLTPEDTT